MLSNQLNEKSFCKNELVEYNNKVGIVIETYDVNNLLDATKTKMLSFSYVLIDKEIIKVSWIRLNKIN